MSLKNALGLYLFFLLAVSIGASTGKADSNPLLEAGINAYQKGKFDDAKASFSQLVSDPRWTFAALYNLGNVAVRQKHLGEALGYYRQALRHKPHDPDALFNLRFVEETLANRRFNGRVSNYELLRTHFLNRFSFNEFLATTLVFSILFLGTLTAALRRRKMGLTEDPGLSAVPPMPVIVTGLFLLIFLSASFVKLYDTYIDRGTIISSNVDLRSGPNETNASMEQIAEGTEILILDSSSDWKQVTFPNGGLAGWIPASAVMITGGGGPF